MVRIHTVGNGVAIETAKHVHNLSNGSTGSSNQCWRGSTNTVALGPQQTHCAREEKFPTKKKKSIQQKYDLKNAQIHREAFGSNMQRQEISQEKHGLNTNAIENQSVIGHYHTRVEYPAFIRVCLNHCSNIAPVDKYLSLHSNSNMVDTS
jgi:hypothetical protein